MHKILRIFLKFCIISLFIPYLFVTVGILLISWLCSFRNKKLSIRIASITSYLSWSIFDLSLKLSSKITIPEIPKDSFLVISNHISSGDFMLVNAINKHLFKDSKYTIKQSLRAIPIFYQGCVLLNFLVLKRNFEMDRPAIEVYLDNLKRMKMPLWFVLFVEGHRFTEERKKESDRFCSERNIEPYKNVLCPRVKGFELIADKLRGSYIKKVLDLTFYCKNPPTLTDVLFSGKVFDIKVDVRIVDLEDIKNPAAFLEESFRRKDKLIDEWKNSE